MSEHYAVKTIQKEIDRAKNFGGMGVHDHSVKLQISHVEYALAQLAQMTAERDELKTDLEIMTGYNSINMEQAKTLESELQAAQAERDELLENIKHEIDLDQVRVDLEVELHGVKSELQAAREEIAEAKQMAKEYLSDSFVAEAEVAELKAKLWSQAIIIAECDEQLSRYESATSVEGTITGMSGIHFREKAFVKLSENFTMGQRVKILVMPMEGV